MQKKEVDRLIEESKSLLSEVREGTDKVGAFADMQLVIFNNSDLSEGSKKVISSTGSKAKESGAKVAILGSTNPEFSKNSSLFTKVVKSELMKLGVEEKNIMLSRSEDKALDNEALQSRLSTLERNEFLLVVLP